MHYNSNKSKGYEPVSSGPNMTGYYMGESPNLMNMMQTGGQTTAGGAALARALQMQKDQKKLEQSQRKEAERQKKGGLFGSIASTAGGLLGAAIGGPAGAAIGAGLGKGLGERFGAGKTRDYDTSGTVFSQQSFRDVDEASEEFNEGMLGRSLLAGAQTGLTAGLTPGGGIYGQYNPLTSTGQQGIKAGLQGLGVTGYTPTQSLTSFGRAQYEGGTGGLAGTGNLTFFDKSRRSLFGGRSLYNLEDGGLIGMQTGGLTAEQILEQQGLEATPEQLALFQRFDPTGISRATEGAGQSLLGMTAGQGLASAGGGFGAQQSSISQIVEQGQKSLEQQIQDQKKAFESQTLGTVADIVSGGGEFDTINPLDNYENPLNTPGSTVGEELNYAGKTYIWSGSNWSLAPLVGTGFGGGGTGTTGTGSTGTTGTGSTETTGIYSTGLSDIKLKKNIKHIGISKKGINIYEFEYKNTLHGKGLYKGVMAQEVPWASFKTKDDLIAVDYSKLDVDFEQVI